MRDLSRRQLARIAGGLLTGAVIPSVATAAGETEIDAPGGRRLLYRLLGEEPSASLATARRRGRGGERTGRVVLVLSRRRRVVAEVDASHYRVSVWSPRLGGLTIEGDRRGVRRVVSQPRPRRRTPRIGSLDTAVATAGGVVLVASAALTQREVPARFIPDAHLPTDYARFCRSLLRRLDRETARRRQRQG